MIYLVSDLALAHAAAEVETWVETVMRTLHCFDVRTAEEMEQHIDMLAAFVSQVRLGLACAMIV